MPEGRHRALADAMLTAQAVLRMFDTGKVLSLDDLKKRAGLKQLVK
jgi:hypothetical protein